VYLIEIKVAFISKYKNILFTYFILQGMVLCIVVEVSCVFCSLLQTYTGFTDEFTAPLTAEHQQLNKHHLVANR
jgi:hypothetical protein